MQFPAEKSRSCLGNILTPNSSTFEINSYDENEAPFGSSSLCGTAHSRYDSSARPEHTFFKAYLASPSD